MQDSATIAMPLFHNENDFELPISCRKLTCEKISRDRFIQLNRKWHSRLPKCGNCFMGFCFGMMYQDKYYAVAWWSHPVARAFNGMDYLELRRMAICEEAPNYTATRFLSQMTKAIRRVYPEVVKLISYQDTEVHSGTIYRAGNWTEAHRTNGDDWIRTNRDRKATQSSVPKIRWEYALKAAI